MAAFQSSARVLLAAALLALPPAAGAEPKASRSDWVGQRQVGCILLESGPAAGDTRGCGACHSQADHGHPVDVDYAQARYRSGTGRDLRPLEEVQRRGTRLVAGRVTCFTCHDGASRFGSHLAIPADALVRPAADLTNVASYDAPPALVPVSKVRSGTNLSPKPLCLTCHALD